MVRYQSGSAIIIDAMHFNLLVSSAVKVMVGIIIINHQRFTRVIDEIDESSLAVKESCQKKQLKEKELYMSARQTPKEIFKKKSESERELERLLGNTLTNKKGGIDCAIQFGYFFWRISAQVVIPKKVPAAGRLRA